MPLLGAGGGYWGIPLTGALHIAAWRMRKGDILESMLPIPEGGDSILSVFSWDPLLAKLQDK